MKLAASPLTLADYPSAIAHAQRQIRTIDSTIIQLQETIAILGVEIEKQIQADNTLTNDQKRKARRLDLQQSDPDYSQCAARLKAVQESRDEKEIELTLLFNTFSVMKLGERRAIAQMELQAVSAA